MSAPHSERDEKRFYEVSFMEPKSHAMWLVRTEADTVRLIEVADRGDGTQDTMEWRGAMDPKNAGMPEHPSTGEYPHTVCRRSVLSVHERGAKFKFVCEGSPPHIAWTGGLVEVPSVVCDWYPFALDYMGPEELAEDNTLVFGDVPLKRVRSICGTSVVAGLVIVSE